MRLTHTPLPTCLGVFECICVCVCVLACSVCMLASVCVCVCVCERSALGLLPVSYTLLYYSVTMSSSFSVAFRTNFNTIRIVLLLSLLSSPSLQRSQCYNIIWSDNPSTSNAYIYININDGPGRRGAFTAVEAGPVCARTRVCYNNNNNILYIWVGRCLSARRPLLYYVIIILLWCTVRITIYIIWKSACAGKTHERRRVLEIVTPPSRRRRVCCKSRARPLVVCLGVNYTRTRRLVLSRRSSPTRVHRVCRCVVRYYHRHRHRHI